jgi:cytoskeletal protein CcmA (bactofilin family)
MSLSVGKYKVGSVLDEPGESQETALLGPGSDFEGTLKASSGRVTLNSRFKGTATSEGTIVIGSEGEITAEISARKVSVSGQLKGSVKASETLEIKARGVVLGDITTPVLIVEPGGYFEGQCHMPIPEAEDAKAEAENAGKLTL